MPWPTELSGITVALTDSNGTTAPAPLLAVTPAQINYLIPDTLAGGWVQVRVARQGIEVARGRLWLEPVAPGLFSADRTGRGPAAAQVLRIKPDGSRSYEPGDQPIGR